MASFPRRREVGHATATNRQYSLAKYDNSRGASYRRAGANYDGRRECAVTDRSAAAIGALLLPPDTAESIRYARVRAAALRTEHGIAVVAMGRVVRRQWLVTVVIDKC